jgi:hypothetical protein
VNNDAIPRERLKLLPFRLKWMRISLTATVKHAAPIASKTTEYKPIICPTGLLYAVGPGIPIL